MTRPLKLLRAALAVIGGVLLAAALAAPASASHPHFEVSDTGEDLCTYYDAKGEAAWSGGDSPDDPAIPYVQIDGVGQVSYAPPGTICLSVVPYEREIEFIAYIEEKPVDEHTEPFTRFSTGPGPGIDFSYSFSLYGEAGAPIDYFTVAICTTEDSGAGKQCTEPVFVGPISTE